MAVSASQDLLQLCCWGCQCFCSTSGPLHCPRITEDGIWNNLSGGYHNLFHISQTCGDGMDYIYILPGFHHFLSLLGLLYSKLPRLHNEIYKNGRFWTPRDNCRGGPAVQSPVGSASAAVRLFL